MSEQAEDTGPKLPALRAGGTPTAIVAQSFEDAWRIAQVVVKSEMAPRGMNTPEKCMVAIMHGAEVGMAPMMALQSIAVINGRPSIWGDGALGLVQGSGKMEWHKEWYTGTPGQDDHTAHFEGKRIHDKEIKKTEFSVADAKRAGLWSKDGPWKQYPPRMLKMRARSFGLRDGWSDVLRGLSIAEEAQDLPMRDVTPQPEPGASPPPSGGPAPPPPPGWRPPSNMNVGEQQVVHHEVEHPRQEPEIIPPAPKAKAPEQKPAEEDDGDGIPEILRRKAQPAPPAREEAQAFDGQPEPPPAEHPDAEPPAPPPRQEPKKDEPKKDEPIDEKAWYAGLKVEFGKCGSVVELGQAQERAMVPMKGKVSKEAYRAATKLIADRITELGKA